MPAAPLPELGSPKAARILAAAGELLRSRGTRGVTVADVAERAHVGKGTVYLYWATKEDLLLGLIARDFLAVADEYVAVLTAEPGLARPSRLCPRIVAIAAHHFFVNTLHSIDAGFLGALADDPRSRVLRDTLGPSALMRAVLPSWRDNGLARTDWALADQALALHALLTGLAATPADHRLRRDAAEPATVLAAAVTALLGPERASPEQVAAAAEGIVLFLTEARTTVLDVLMTPAQAVSEA